MVPRVNHVANKSPLPLARKGRSGRWSVVEIGRRWRRDAAGINGVTRALGIGYILLSTQRKNVSFCTSGFVKFAGIGG